MKNLIRMFFLFAVLPLAVEAQMADTLFLTIDGDLAGVTFQSFEVNLRIGDSVQYVAQALDSEGDPLLSGVIYTFASSDTTLLRIDAITGWARALRKAQPRDSLFVYVRAEWGGLQMRLAMFRGGKLDFSGDFDVPHSNWVESPGDSTWWEGNDSTPGRWVYGYRLEPATYQFCAYIIDGGGYLVAQSEAPPLCPHAFPERPTPTPYAMFEGLSRIRPDLFLFRTAG